MAHSHHMHREHQVGHRRVANILKDEPQGAMQHFDGGAFSRVTSKTAAEDHDMKATGGKAAKRYARGGKVKDGTTNIAIVLPSGNRQGTPPMPMPAPGAPPPPMAGPGPMPGGPPGAPPMGPPGMPRARGGRAMGSLTDKADLKKWSKRASDNSYFRGGAASGVGREEKAAQMKRKGR